jgi:hypothetical protein
MSSINTMEDPMTALKSLTFTTLPQPGANPVLDRRARTIARLEEQKLLLNDPAYTRTVRNWVRKDGERTLVEKQERVSPWWRVFPDGSYGFFVRSGVKPIEFERGKTAVAMQSLDMLPSIIDALIVAVRNGELDDQLAKGSKQATVKKSRRAA